MTDRLIRPMFRLWQLATTLGSNKACQNIGLTAFHGPSRRRTALLEGACALLLRDGSELHRSWRTVVHMQRIDVCLEGANLMQIQL